MCCECVAATRTFCQLWQRNRHSDTKGNAPTPTPQSNLGEPNRQNNGQRTLVTRSSNTACPKTGSTSGAL